MTRGRKILRAISVSLIPLFGIGAASAQVISNVTATNSTNTSTVITWTTDQPASSLVNYGVTTNYGASSATNSALTTAHSVTLSGLNANTLYDFDVVSVGTGNATVTSANYRFATLRTAPLISNINVIYLTSNSATINWTTDQPATDQVNYGTTTNYGSASPLGSTPVIAHTVTLSGLTPGTTYNFDVVSTGLANAASASSNQTFTTPAASATAPTVSYGPGSYGVNGLTNSTAVITWTTNVPAGTVVAYGLTPALGQFSPVQTAQATSGQITLTGLSEGTTYYFLIECTGAGGATGYSIPSNFTTTGPTSLVPAITNVAVSNLTATAATISWTTDLPSTSQVSYGTTTSYGSSSPLDPTLTNSHSITLTGLTAGTLYDFEVTSVATSGGASFGANMSGITVWAWGDSLTLGYGEITQNTYPLYLATLIGVPVSNQGVGGQTSTQIAARMLATPAAFTPGNCNIFWAGANNPDDVSTVLADVASMVNALQAPPCYLVMGDINKNYSPLGTSTYNNIISTNTTEAALYGSNYLNIRELLVQDYNPTLPMDIASHANDLPAESLHAVRPQGTITSGALDNHSCAISVSSTTNGAGTALIIDSETILINAIPDGTDVTSCTRGYNNTTATSHAANSTYSLIDPVHLSAKGYDFVAQQVAGWLSTQFPFTFTTSAQSPVISAVSVSGITSSSAVVNWATDQPATSLVNYGAGGGSAAVAGTNTPLTTTHSVMLTGLTPGTAYNFNVVSANSAGQSSASASAAFMTSAAQTQVPVPVISSVAAVDLTSTSATISWNTDTPAMGQVNYGLTIAYGTQSPATTTLATSQALTLTGLTASTTYNFQVIAAGSSGAEALSTNYTFTTPAVGAAAPYVGYVAFWGVSNTSVTISWSTDVNANTVVAYGTTQALGQYYVNAASGSSSTVSHGAVLTGLTPGTKYYFVCESTGASGATGYSTTYTFTTTGTAPAGFSLSASAATATAGSSGTSAVTVTPSSGFSSGVTLAASGWPAGITGAFGTNPATASSTVTISVGQNVAPGSYVLPVSGTSGTLSASTSIPLTVSGPPSFALNATAATAMAGGSGTSTITMTPANGFNSAVTLATSGWPSGIAGTFGTSAGSSSVITISVSAGVAPGSYLLTVTGTSGALSASTVISLIVNPSSQTITFGAIAAQTVGVPLTLSASATSGLAVSYTSSTTNICTVSGSTATFLAAGTCTITASQGGNTSYSAASSVSQSFAVNAAALQSQTITFNAIPAQTVGTTLTVSATASSSLPVTFTVVVNGNCSISGNLVTFVNPGNCGVIANQAGNSTYAAAPTVGQIIVVNQPVAKTAQTITFTAIANQTLGTPLTLSASASSGLAVNFASSTTGTCTVSGTTATFVAAGTCTITASQAGNSTYASATPVSQTFTVKAAPTVVNLAPVFNIHGIVANGQSASSGGLDTSSYAYSSNLLGTSLTVGGISFNLGPAGAADAVSSTKVTLPAGSYSTLYFLGTGIYGNQANQQFTVTYTDGTTTVTTQSLSDWSGPQGNSGESIASTMAYRVTPSGGTQGPNWCLYEYSIALNPGKTVQSITLPSIRNVVVLAMTLAY